MNKNQRQLAVLDVLKSVSLSSQEELQRELKKRGIEVAQATLSRDIRDLGLAKTSVFSGRVQNLNSFTNRFFFSSL